MLISRFGSVDNVLHASIDELMEIDGIGRLTAERLVSLGQIMDKLDE